MSHAIDFSHWYPLKDTEIFKDEFTLCQDMNLAPVMTESFKTKLIFLPHLEKKSL